jgi:hypothetical protein
MRTISSNEGTKTRFQYFDVHRNTALVGRPVVRKRWGAMPINPAPSGAKRTGGDTRRSRRGAVCAHDSYAPERGYCFSPSVSTACAVGHALTPPADAPQVPCERRRCPNLQTERFPVMSGDLGMRFRVRLPAGLNVRPPSRGAHRLRAPTRAGVHRSTQCLCRATCVTERKQRRPHDRQQEPGG